MARLPASGSPGVQEGEVEVRRARLATTEPSAQPVIEDVLDFGR